MKTSMKLRVLPVLSRMVKKRRTGSLQALFAFGLACTPFTISCSDDIVLEQKVIEPVYEFIPAPDAGGVYGATMPYTRYDSESAELSGGAELRSSENFDRDNIASQASRQSYVALPSAGAAAEWTVTAEGDGVVMRFTMPDSNDGKGRYGSLDIDVNGVKAKTIELNSYHAWVYFHSGQYDDGEDTYTSGDISCFAFDEVHFKLDTPLVPGDKIRVRNSGAGGMEYGVDFLEIEPVPAPIPVPSDAVIYQGGDLEAAIEQATEEGKKTVYIPAGTHEFGRYITIKGNGIKITGAGMWHTNIKFTSDKRDNPGGGVKGDCSQMEFCHMYIDSNINTRRSGQYHGFCGYWGNNTVIHNIWQEHFVSGFWIADYDKSRTTKNLRILNCRIRNNYADGVNFHLGTSYSTVYNCSVRNNGDDGLAMWNLDQPGIGDELQNMFCYNTIDLGWRASFIAIFGGDRHWIYNNYLCDTFLAAGVRMNGYYSGYRFSNTSLILFENNVFVRCGSKADIANNHYHAIDIEDSHPKNVEFRNTTIYGSQDGDIHLDGSVKVYETAYPSEEPSTPPVGSISETGFTIY